MRGIVLVLHREVLAQQRRAIHALLCLTGGGRSRAKSAARSSGPPTRGTASGSPTSTSPGTRRGTSTPGSRRPSATRRFRARAARSRYPCAGDRNFRQLFVSFSNLLGVISGEG